MKPGRHLITITPKASDACAVQRGGNVEDDAKNSASDRADQERDRADAPDTDRRSCRSSC